ncbi:hypothetical protein HELRODRAFT_192545 [Helobdella robusta]|uniref:Carbonic anhydrase 1 n=1 Tax=Helobdella robusta TaxID=6412 RepID=T1FU24_HELRO|nr:hypothetical protein HELRODRAFT_192545 [Helobdella robusta]ESO00617.1 hypothetical protein HELRODRAFT_192545 [Helobdella robusta]
MRREEQQGSPLLDDTCPRYHVQDPTGSYDLTKYWTYKGSFTTPPCYETVTWIVFHNSISITSEDLARFRTLKSYEETEQRPNDEFDGNIARNCRLVQPMGTRRVYTAENIHNQYLACFDDPFRLYRVAPTAATAATTSGSQSVNVNASTAQRVATFPDSVRKYGRA